VTIRIAINGFGRIGRLTFRNLMSRSSEFEVVAVNDLTDNQMLATLLKYDSVHGRYDATVGYDADHLIVNGKKIFALAEKDPAKLPWAEHKIDIVIESTGFFTGRAKDGKPGYDTHLTAGCKKVVLSAPAKDGADLTCVLGVNDHKLTPDLKCISNASCTTNCFVPMIKVLDDAFGVEKGLMTTVHAYTGDQMLVDGPHNDLRRARAAAVNIVPTSTGAARATGLVLQSMQGRLDGTSLRVPVSDGSVTDFTGILSKDATVEEINEAFRAAASSGPLSKVLTYSTDPIVSSDIVGSPASCTFDAPLTMSQGNLVKILGWYDNEWGYSNRLVDLVKVVSGKR